MNRSNIPLIGATLALLTCAGCSSKLVLSKDSTKGLALPTPIAYVEFFAKNKHSKGSNCAAVLEARHIALPGDPQHYVNVEPRSFAKTGLVVKYSDRGLVSEVAFNTEPSADAITAATGAATALLPFLGVLPKAQPPAVTAAADDGTTKGVDMAAGQRVACDAGEVPLRLITLKDYLNSTTLKTLVDELRAQIEKW